jgi:hypothetical protein
MPPVEPARHRLRRTCVLHLARQESSFGQGRALPGDRLTRNESDRHTPTQTGGNEIRPPSAAVTRATGSPYRRSSTRRRLAAGRRIVLRRVNSTWTVDAGVAVERHGTSRPESSFPGPRGAATAENCQVSRKLHTSAHRDIVRIEPVSVVGRKRLCPGARRPPAPAMPPIRTPCPARRAPSGPVHRAVATGGSPVRISQARAATAARTPGAAAA